MVKTPITIAYEDLLKKVQLEQRVYRHRCVEAWSFVAPWTGFPMNQLLKIAEPLGSAKYVVFTTVEQPKAMPGLDEPIHPWPYVEGVTIQEAANDWRSFRWECMARTAEAGWRADAHDGAVEIRLQVRQVIREGQFHRKAPADHVGAIAPDEYGFWANVNPAVSHPRWSQATERVIGSDERVPTQIYNGYGEFVSSLYDGLKGEKLFM